MIYGIEQTVTYIAWNAEDNAPETGDAANHTLRWIANGVSNAPANAPAEVDAANAPGVYALTLTAAEWQTYQGTLAGASSTAGVEIIPQQFTTVRLPDAAPGADGGLGTVDASNRVAGIAGTKNVLDDLHDISAGDAASEILATPAQKLATDASGHVTAENMRGTDGAAQPGAEMALTAVERDAVRDGLVTGTDVSDLQTHGDANWVGLTTEQAVFLRSVRAFARGRVTIADGVFTFYDTDGTTPLFTMTPSAAGRTVT